MKILSLIILIVAAPAVYAQTLSGICTDLSGNPVEYVTIGIAGTATGTISDRRGNFSLHIPESLRRDSLHFSHISFETGVYSVEKLLGEPDPAGLKIRLRPADFQLETAVVRPQARVVNLNSRGSRMPGLTVTYHFNSYRHDIGQIIELPRKSRIRELELDISSSMEKLVVRVLLYSVKNSEISGKMKLIPLISSPRYVDVEGSGKMQGYLVDFKDEIIETEDPVYVRLELVERSGSGIVSFPAYSGTTKYFIDMHTARIDKYPIGIGLRLRGSMLK